MAGTAATGGRATARRPPPKTGSGSGLDPPPPPCLGVILDRQNPPKSDPKRVEFFRIFPACGAAPRGGGGAPPTTLILLRNQRTRVDAASQGRDRRDGAIREPLSVKKIRKKHRFFFEDVVCARARLCGNRLRRCGRRPGPAGPASPIAEVSDRRDGGLPAVPTHVPARS